MAYTINKTDGTIIATIPDGTINTTVGGITLVGRNYTGYGEFIAENLVMMIEHQATEGVPPTNPMVGQVWYDKTTAASALKVYDGVEWKTLGTVTTNTTAPPTPVTGDLWYDVDNSQIKVYDGTEFILVGGGPGAGLDATGIEVETVTDTLTFEHVIVKLMVDGIVTGIISKDATFIPNDAIAGFATISPGIQLSTSVADAKFTGTATNAELLDGNLPTAFVSSTDPDTMDGTLGIINDGGLTVGAASDAKIEVVTNDVYFSNTTLNADMFLRVNQAGTPTAVISIDGLTGRASVATPTAATNQIANANYVESAAAAAAAASLQDAEDVPSTPVGNVVATDVQAAIAELDTDKEPAFAKNTAFNKAFGTTAGTVSEGNHTHAAGTLPYVNLDGSNTPMTGALRLSGDPTLTDHATTKNYTDSNYAHAGCRISKSVNGSGGIVYSPVEVTFPIEDWDTQNWHLSGGRFTVPSSLYGTAISEAYVSVEYSLHAVDYAAVAIQWYDLSAGQIHTVQVCNPSDNPLPGTIVQLNDYFSGSSGIIRVAPGDWFRLYAYPNFPVPLTSITQADDTSWFSLTLYRYG
jgi:hypothetical protein